MNLFIYLIATLQQVIRRIASPQSRIAAIMEADLKSPFNSFGFLPPPTFLERWIDFRLLDTYYIILFASLCIFLDRSCFKRRPGI